MRRNSVAAVSGEERRKWRARWPVSLAWSIFATGILVQAFSPGLKVEHHKFVAPAATSRAQEIKPVEIIARERRVQLLSAILTVAGALGLAVYYGPTLFRRDEP
jgi:hypothetical protein